MALQLSLNQGGRVPQSPPSHTAASAQGLLGSRSIVALTGALHESINFADRQWCHARHPAGRSAGNAARSPSRTTGPDRHQKSFDRGQCGACTVLVDGRRISSCLALALSCDGRHVLTIEGVARGSELHPVQAAFIAHDDFQCGFCTPGQIMSAIGLSREGHDGDDPERVRESMSGNPCRCGAYAGTTDAVLEAQKSVRERALEFVA